MYSLIRHAGKSADLCTECCLFEGVARRAPDSAQLPSSWLHPHSSYGPPRRSHLGWQFQQQETRIRELQSQSGQQTSASQATWSLTLSSRLNKERSQMSRLEYHRAKGNLGDHKCTDVSSFLYLYLES